MPVKLKLVIVGIVVLSGLAVFFAVGETDAIPPRFPFYVCLHNGCPYAVVALEPGQTVAVCPERDESYFEDWDSCDGYDCSNSPCLKTRHIDCEFTSEPGGV